MFADVCINNFSGKLIDGVSPHAIEAYRKRNKDIFVDLEEYLLGEENIISADKIIDKLFPQIDVDIFLSHSHSDQDDVIKLAIKLEELGLKVFVDSCYWGYVLELQEKIDLKYSKREGSLKYNKVLRTSTSINMILSSALHRMIDQTEAFIFVNTPHAINIKNELSVNPTTSSAWIFSELFFVSRVQRKIPERIANYKILRMEAASLEHLREDLQIRFEVDLPEYKIEFSKFSEWIGSISKKYRPGMRFGEYFNYSQSDGRMHLNELYKQLKIIGPY